MSTAAVDATKTASVTVGGWNFAINLEGWRVSDNLSIASHTNFGDQIGDWTGLDAVDDSPDGSFGLMYYPMFPNAPKGNREYNDAVALVSYISVLKIPKNFIDNAKEHDIAIYGSADKMPDEKKKMDLQNNVDDAMGGWVSSQEQAIKAHPEGKRIIITHDQLIDFNGHMAYLYEDGFPNGGQTSAIMSVLLDNDTVAVIPLMDWNSDPVLKYMDGTPYTHTIEDILKSLTITKS